MEQSFSYYTFQTEENKEFVVSGKVKEKFKKFDVIIPTEEKILFAGGRRFMYYERLLPDYIFIGAENLTQKDFDEIRFTKGIINSKVLNSPEICKLSKEDTNKFIVKPLKKTNAMLQVLIDELKVGKSINIISGQYANYTAIVRSVNDNCEINVTVNIPSKPKTILPLWFIGQEIKDKVEA